jgi:hypothetical protein
MPLSGKEIVSLGRAATMAAAMIAASGALQVTGEPLFTVIVRMVFNLAAAQSEAKKLREKAAVSLVVQQHIPNSVKHA